MRERDRPEAARLDEAISRYEHEVMLLPGLAPPEHRDVFIEQAIQSCRRPEYIRRLLEMDLGRSRLHPESGKFDPLKAAVLHKRNHSIEEASWLVFLGIHFGKHRRGQWRYASDVYGRLGQGSYWTWEEVVQDIGEFELWIAKNSQRIRDSSRPGGFGNHRKYESLVETGSVVKSYVDWVKYHGSHQACFETAYAEAAQDKTIAFDVLYNSMSSIYRFGRTARFDYLSMLHKLEFASIHPGRPYLIGSTGPLRGAKLLFGISQDDRSTAIGLEEQLIELEGYIDIGFDPLEDALCNWQKSPSIFMPFRG